MKEVKKFRFIPILLAVILAVFLLLSSVTTIPADVPCVSCMTALTTSSRKHCMRWERLRCPVSSVVR